MIKNSTYTSSHRLKNRLFEEGYAEKKCYKCGITEWDGQPTPLDLHHLNGIRTDNRIENLMILCPNCHAQTKNYCAKNIKIKPKSYHCKDCGKEISSSKYMRCVSCEHKKRKTK